MKLGYVILYVKSVPSSLAFYKTAFNLSTRFCVPSNEYGEIELAGATTLAFAEENFVEKSVGEGKFRVNRLDEEKSAGAEISFVVDEEKGESVDEAVKRAKEAGAVVVQEAKTKPWGQIVAYVRDCNGFLVEICTPVKAG
jgi:lactoylglutathione lyase